MLHKPLNALMSLFSAGVCSITHRCVDSRLCGIVNFRSTSAGTMGARFIDYLFADRYCQINSGIKSQFLNRISTPWENLCGRKVCGGCAEGFDVLLGRFHKLRSPV